MKPTLIQIVRVPIKGRVEIMSLLEVQTLIGSLSHLLRAHSSDSHGIKLAVCAEFDVRLDQLDSDQRPERIAFPRQVGYWLHRTLTDMSLGEIGAHFPRRNGKARDHGTILHGCRAVEARMEQNEKMRARLLALQARLSSEEKITP